LFLFKNFYFQRTRFDSYHAGLTETLASWGRVWTVSMYGGESLVTSYETHFGEKWLWRQRRWTQKIVGELP